MKPIILSQVHADSRLHASPVMLTLALSAMLCAPLNATETDDRIVSAAQSSYVFKTFLIDDAIKTESKDGAVTLSGTVHEDSHKQLAQETVSGLPGVTSVSNMIEVKDSPSVQSDTWLYLKVKGTLAYHNSVSAYNTKVDLKQGVVTLTGDAASQAQKDLTTEYAMDIDGVKEVKNEMTVTANAPGPSLAEIIDDASINAQVRMALLTHRSTSAFRTIVATTNGAVIVGGVARNTAEKELVTKLVTDIHGVKSVVNSMVVEPAVTKN